MAGRLGVDFGTSNTVLAVWDETRKQGEPLHLPDYGRWYEHGQERVSVVPSLVHYAADRRRWIGDQVHQHNLYHSEATFRWMKRAIGHRYQGRRRIHGTDLTDWDAGRDFLSTVLRFGAEQLNLGDEEVAFTAPVEAFEHYTNWLTEVSEEAHLPRFRLIDEPSAAALGYGAHIQPGQVYLIFDFGGGTLDVAMVLVEDQESAVTGLRCRVLGKAGAELGGAIIDQWLFQEVLRLTGRSDADEELRPLSRSLLVDCERAKEELSEKDRASISVMNPDTGMVLGAELTRAQFEELLDRHEAFQRMDQTVRRAINEARERGYTEENIRAVLMLGGCSLIPSVQRALQRVFGRDKVMVNRPLDAVARGAAALVAGLDFYDHIQHDYAIRHYNPKKGDYEYRPIVKRGTPYPTKEPLARLTIKASHAGQTQLGIAIYELGEQHDAGPVQPVELVFDPSGAARIMTLTPDEAESRRRFWVNEQNPTFLRADPPAVRGEPRFEADFAIDSNKRLLITARDLKTGKTTHRDFPVVKLT